MKVTALVTETQDCRIFRFNEGADQFAGAAAAFVTVGTEIVAVSGLVQLGFPLSICNRFIVTFSLPCSTSTSRKTGFAFLPIGIGSLIGGWFGGVLIHHFGEVTHQPARIWWSVSAVGVATAVFCGFTIE